MARESWTGIGNPTFMPEPLRPHLNVTDTTLSSIVIGISNQCFVISIPERDQVNDNYVIFNAFKI